MSILGDNLAKPWETAEGNSKAQDQQVCPIRRMKSSKATLLAPVKNTKVESLEDVEEANNPP